MTATEAQMYADREWQRWVLIVVALIELESQKTQVQQSAEAQTVDTTAPIITLSYEYCSPLGSKGIVLEPYIN